MAKLPALIETLSRHDERDQSTLEHVARTVREAGYIPTTKRGVGASGMTIGAATNLFLALNGCDAPKDAARAVDRFRSLQLRELTAVAPEQDDLQKLLTAETFGVAIERLIDCSNSISKWLCEWLEANFDERVSEAYKRDLMALNWSLLPIQFDVVLFRHPYGAQITLRRLYKRPASAVVSDDPDSPSRWRPASGDVIWRTEFNAEFVSDFDLQETGFYGRSKSRRITVALPAKVLWDISRTLNGEDLEGGAVG